MLYKSWDSKQGEWYCPSSSPPLLITNTAQQINWKDIIDKIKDLPLESQYRITRSLEDNRVSFLSSGPHLYNEKMLEHLEKCL